MTTEYYRISQEQLERIHRTLRLYAGDFVAASDGRERNRAEESANQEIAEARMTYNLDWDTVRSLRDFHQSEIDRLKRQKQERQQ